MNFVTSKDGTRIAYDKIGYGKPLILVDGALCSRKNGPNGALAALLQQHFTVYTYDRRGRGESGDASSYQVEREIEDLTALIEIAGGSAYVYGISSGAALAIEAAQRLNIIKLAVYEAPFVIDNSRKPVPIDYLDRMKTLIASNRRERAVKHFMREGVGMPAPIVAIMPMMPAWSKLKEVAHTLEYDTLLTIELQQGRKDALSRWESVTVPTLVAVGGKSPAWMRSAMRELANIMPNSEHRILEGQTHIIKASVLAPVLQQFFAE